MNRQETLPQRRQRLRTEIAATRRAMAVHSREAAADAGIALLGLAAGRVLVRKPWFAALASVAAVALRVLRSR